MEIPGKNSSKQSRGDPGGALLDLTKLVSQIATGSSSIDDHLQGSLLTLPGFQKLHSLRENLNLLACHLCGDSTRTEAF